MLVAKKPYKQMCQDFYEEKHRLAQLAWLKISQRPEGHYYLCGTKRLSAPCDITGVYQRIWNTLTILDSYEHDKQKPHVLLVSPEQIRKNATLEMMESQIDAMLKREPLGIFAE